MQTIVALPNDYVVIDIETTGLDFLWDDIIEIAAIKVRNGIIVSQYCQLVSIPYSVPSYITDLTGITDEMLAHCPSIDKVIQAFDNFVGSDTVIGHNVCFDVHFLAVAYAKHLGKSFDNPCVDTMRIARKQLPELAHHRLADLATHYGISSEGSHRSGKDCEVTNSCYRILRDSILSAETEDEYVKRFFQKGPRISANPSKYLTPTTTEFDPDHPFYQKTIVFTGALSQMTRAEAMQMVLDCGGICGTGVTKNTNYLVVGTSDYISATEGKKTRKMLKVEQLRSQGFDIANISENVFLELMQNAE